MFDITIIGSGVAGMTVALYALRGEKSVLILERENYGGQIAKSPKVENYPTIKSISGYELSDKMYDQIIDLGATFELEEVLGVAKENGVFKITTDYNTYESRAVVLANGVKPRTLNLENESRLLGKGVYYCAICDGPFFRGEEVVLVGDGNSAMQYALLLAGYCKKVTLVTMFDKFFGEKSLEESVRNNAKIEIIPNAVASKLIGEDSLTAVEFRRQNGETFTINTPAIFVAIGQVADNEKYKNFVELDKSGYVVSDETCRTKTEGFFVAGDTRAKQVRQVATAVGDGAVAGTQAINYVNSFGEL